MVLTRKEQQEWETYFYISSFATSKQYLKYDGLVFFRMLHLRFIRVWLSESHVIAHEAQEKIAGILWLKQCSLYGHNQWPAQSDGQHNLVGICILLASAWHSNCLENLSEILIVKVQLLPLLRENYCCFQSVLKQTKSLYPALLQYFQSWLFTCIGM